MFNWLDPYSQFVGVSLLINVLLVLSLFVAFQCGVLSLASVGFAADGAYTAALLNMKEGWPPALSIAAGALAAGLLALVFGRLILHLRGIYLALGSFALGQVCVLVIADMSFTGGNEGIIGHPDHRRPHHRRGRRRGGLRPAADPAPVADRAGAAGDAPRRPRRGRGRGRHAGLPSLGLRGQRRHRRVGPRPARSSTVTISPGQYDFTLLVQILAMAMIGGAYHWSGGVIAALVIGIIQQDLGQVAPLVQGLLYGGLLVVVMMLLPEGIIDRRGFRWVRGHLPGRRGTRQAIAGLQSAGGR